MDPTHDPNFRPPSTNPPTEPTLPSKLIPNRQPIQPTVLADFLEPIDQPILPARSKDSNNNSILNSNSTNSNINSRNNSNSNSNSPNILNMSPKDKDPKSHSHSIKHKILKLPTELEPFSSSDEENDSRERNNSKNNDTNNGNHIEVDIDLNLDLDDENNRPPFSRTVSICEGPKVHSYQIADLEEVPHGIQRQSKNLEDYKFPSHRLKKQMSYPNKYPLVIVACGSFSPITYLHLRMFEMALDSIRESTRFEVVGGYFSPVSDNYKKPGLAPSYHRVRMCELACERTSSWLMVDAWESLQAKYTRTALVLDHFNEEINIKNGGILSSDGKSRVGAKIMLLAGGDLIESMGEPNVWAEQDLHHILGNYGCLIVERTGSDARSFLLSHDIMYEHRKNILVIKQLIYNDISSTKVRLFIRRNMSVQYLLPNSVIRYIQEHGLYVNDKEPVKVVLNIE